MVSSQLTLYFLLLMLFLCIIKAIPMINSPDNMLQIKGDRGTFFMTLLTLYMVWWFGHRQFFGGGYVDTANYAREYIGLQPVITTPDLGGEWLWTLIMQTCKVMGCSTSTFFTIVEAGYLLPLVPATKKFLPSNPGLGLLFIYSSLFFLPFGVNGIRNGLACNILILAFAYLFEGKYIIAAVIAILCFGIHRSTLLPIAAVTFTVFYFRDVKICVYIWFISIILSLFASSWFINFFASLGFDDRMSQYAQELDTSAFSKTGFRWDFLLYSSFPVFLSWYVYEKKRISDNWFNALACTYLLCNSFWVLVITASYSNRFAYLSWFMYPLVIAYPLVILPVWHDQDNRTGMILLAYIGFTLLMNYLWHAF